MNLKKIRTQQGWTQQQLADMLEVHVTSISRMENGKILVDKRTELAVLYLIKNN